MSFVGSGDINFNNVEYMAPDKDLLPTRKETKGKKGVKPFSIATVNGYYHIFLGGKWVSEEEFHALRTFEKG